MLACFQSARTRNEHARNPLHRYKYDFSKIEVSHEKYMPLITQGCPRDSVLACLSILCTFKRFNGSHGERVLIFGEIANECQKCCEAAVVLGFQFFKEKYDPKDKKTHYFPDAYELINKVKNYQTELESYKKAFDKKQLEQSSDHKPKNIEPPKPESKPIPTENITVTVKNLGSAFRVDKDTQQATPREQFYDNLSQDNLDVVNLRSKIKMPNR